MAGGAGPEIVPSGPASTPKEPKTISLLLITGLPGAAGESPAVMAAPPAGPAAAEPAATEAGPVDGPAAAELPAAADPADDVRAFAELAVEGRVASASAPTKPAAAVSVPAWSVDRP